MKAVISRKYGNLQTTGKMVVFDEDKIAMQCVTLELPSNGNQIRTSCINEGSFLVTKIYSPTKGKCFLLHDVPGRSAIEIHKGNFAAGKKVDTLGCILPGSGFEDINDDGNLDVIESTATLDKLLNLLPNQFMLHII